MTNKTSNSKSIKSVLIGLRTGFMELSRAKRTLIITISISLVLMFFASLTRNLGILANAILLSTFIVAVPQFLMMYDRYVNIKEMEKKFPVFLRDIIESLNSGMPLHKSIISVSNYDYGKLSPEIRKISNQLTWGVPLEKVLNQFAKRMKKSKRLFTSIKIIRESHLSGGNVISTIDTVADNSKTLEDAEKERRSTLNQYVILMYVITLVFIGIIVAINNLMIPIFEVTASGAGDIIGVVNPCQSSSFGITNYVCSLYKGTAFFLFSIDPTTISAYYISLFFYMSLVQSIFSGLVAGQIGENSVRAGIKHSLIMVSITLGSFYLLIYFGFLGV